VQVGIADVAGLFGNRDQRCGPCGTRCSEVNHLVNPRGAPRSTGSGSSRSTSRSSGATMFSCPSSNASSAAATRRRARCAGALRVESRQRCKSWWLLQMAAS
jgi:hypothetical protein